MIKLSRHFRERWKTRVQKTMPTPKDVEEMIDGALFLQRCKDLFSARGNRHRILAMYWITDQGFIIKVDEKTGTAVTVLTEDMVDEGMI